MVINGLSSNLGTIWISDSSSSGICIFYLQAEPVYSKYIDGGTGRKLQEIGRHYHSTHKSTKEDTDRAERNREIL